jgi:hypothetical protein
METVMILGVGMDVGVGIAWEVGTSCFLSGFGISTKAMLGRAGVAGFAQLESNRADAMAAKQTLE